MTHNERVDYVSATLQQTNCTANGTVVTCDIGTLAPNENALVTITAIGRTAGTYTNRAEISADQSGISGSASVTTEVTGDSALAADISISIEGSPEPVNIASDLTYTITVGNQGPDAANDVELTSTLPSELRFIRSEATQGSCRKRWSRLSCSLGTLASGDDVVITLGMRTRRKDTTIDNTFDVAANNPEDPNSSNNRATIRSNVKRDRIG